MAKTEKVHRCECAVCQAGTDLETVRHHEQMNLFRTC